MNVRAYILDHIFGDLVEARVREATLAEEDRHWRSLSQAAGARDVSYRELLDSINDSAEAYRVNPVAYRLVELTTDYVLGKGMALKADQEAVQGFVDAFWQANRMDVRQFELCTELSLSGELFVTFHTSPFDGMTLIRCIPAAAVDRVETNPEDVEDERRYHRAGAVANTVEGIEWSGAPEGGLDGRWWTREECRHYTVNRLLGAVRGQGDLVPLLPWLRRYKDWLTDRVRINKFKGAFLWDVKLTGAGERAILARQAQLVEPPNPGSVIVHNEKEEWKAVQPAIDAQAVEPDGYAIRLMLAAGAGVPLHFVGEGSSANWATAREMREPTLRHYQRRQLYFGWMMADIVGEAIRRSGRFKGAEVQIEPQFGELSADDRQQAAKTASAVSQALGLAQERGWIGQAEARAMFQRFCGAPLGFMGRADGG